MQLRYLALRWTPSVFEKPQATCRTQATRTLGSASMRPSPYLPRFSLLKGRMIPGGEIEPQIYPTWYILLKHLWSLFANMPLLLLFALWQGIRRQNQFRDQRWFRRDNGTYRSSSKHVWRVSFNEEPEESETTIYSPKPVSPWIKFATPPPSAAMNIDGARSFADHTTGMRETAVWPRPVRWRSGAKGCQRGILKQTQSGGAIRTSLLTTFKW